jgi:hypothetical protein
VTIYSETTVSNRLFFTNVFVPPLTPFSLYFVSIDLWLASRSPRPRFVKNLLRSHLRAHMDFMRRGLPSKGNTAIMRFAKATARRIEQNQGVRKSMYDIVGQGALSAAVDECWDDDDLPGREPVVELSPVISNEHLAMLRALAEDEGEDEELAESYAEGKKSNIGIQSDVLPNDLVSDYLDEINRVELVGSIEDADAATDAVDDLPVPEVKADSEVDNTENDDGWSFDGHDHNDEDDNDHDHDGTRFTLSS